jgi:superoxide dismutase, Fe-Mn family
MEYAPRTFTFPKIPGISPEQLKLHVGLYEGYVKHVNLLMSQMNALAAKGDEFTYTINAVRRRLGFEWNGMRLHELYFEALEEGPKPLRADSALYLQLKEQYGGYTQWLEVFTKLTARGPGWGMLNYDPQAKRFFHNWVSDHEIGQLATLPALIAVDHWEHAYLIDYTPAEKTAYVTAYLNALNWDIIAKRFDTL